MNKPIPTGFITGLGKHSAKSFGTDLGMDKVIKAETGFKFMNFERKVLQQYHPLLVEIWLGEFWQKLSCYFTLYFGKLSPLQHSCRRLGFGLRDFLRL